MNLSPLAHLRLLAVLAGAYVLLGYEAPSSRAVQELPVYPTLPSPTANPLVTVNTETPTVVTPPVTPETDPASQATAHPPVTLSSHLQEVVKLAQSGVGDDVILAFIQNSSTPFSPTPDEILYLTDLGISDVIVTALVNHMATAAQPLAAAQPPAPGPVSTPTAIPMMPGAQTPPPEPAVTYNPEPAFYSPPPVDYEEAPPAEDNSYFYSALAPYGSWVEVPDYGMCWQPTVAVIQVGWVPYCHHGRWLYTDCGYYWQSDYSWGWAPFHYGRWFHHPGRGWCWRPDSAWAPAWVSWRYTDTHCGWAPLPPGAHYHAGVGFTYYGAHVSAGFAFGLHHDAWTFVSAGRLHEPEVWRHRVAPAEQPHIFRTSHVVNNYAVHNDIIVNHGVRDRVPVLARAEPRKIAIRDLPERPAAGVRPDRLRQEGSDVVVYRPKPPVTAVAPNRAETPRVATGIAERTATRPANSGAASMRPAPSGVRQEVVKPAGSGSAEKYSSYIPSANRQLPRNESAPTVGPGQPTSNQSARPINTPEQQRALSQAPLAMQSRQPAAYPSAAVQPRSAQPNPEPGTTARPSQSWSPAAVPSRPAPAYSVPNAPTRAGQPYSPGNSSAPAAPAYSAPAYSAPAVANRPAPNYSAPAVQRSAPAYANPGVQSVPSYSAPAAAPSRPQPAPSYSAPVVRSAPAPAANVSRRQQ